MVLNLKDLIILNHCWLGESVTVPPSIMAIFTLKLGFQNPLLCTFSSV